MEVSLASLRRPRIGILGNLKLRLRTKLVSWFLVASILPLLVAGYLAYRAVNQQAEQAAFREVVTIAGSASQAVTEFMNSRCTEVLIRARQQLIAESLTDVGSERRCLPKLA